MTEERHLFGAEGDENLYFDLAEYYETEQWLPWDAEIGGKMPADFRFEIAEYSVCAPRSHMPDLDRWLERISEDIAENGLLDENGWEAWDNALDKEGVREAFDAAFDLWASKVSYRMADAIVAIHILTFDENDEPLIDGKPLYVKREEL